MSEVELQQELERFSGQLADRLTQAMEPLVDAGQPRLRRAALRQQLNYFSAVFDIVSAPVTEVNLLDMLVLVRLAHATLERHWIPVVFGAAGEPVGHAFAVSETDLTAIAGRFMEPAKLRELEDLVRAWLASHPHQNYVEAVRLSSFAELAGELAEEQARRARGLLASVKSATASADRALLLAERAVFLAHRLPIVLRLQARLALIEILDDALCALKSAARHYAPHGLLLLGAAMLARGIAHRGGSRRRLLPG
jgi:hypothetical protein